MGTNGGYRTEEFVGSQITHCLKFFIKKSRENFSHSFTKFYQILSEKSNYFQYFLIYKLLILYYFLIVIEILFRMILGREKLDFCSRN